MFDKIFKMFFTETKQTKKATCITVVRESSLFNENQIIEYKRTKKKIEASTCLSQYFKDIKGLNFEQRQRAKLYMNR